MSEHLEMSPSDKHKAKFGDENQAHYLLLAKENSSPAKRTNKKDSTDEKEIKEEKANVKMDATN